MSHSYALPRKRVDASVYGALHVTMYVTAYAASYAAPDAALDGALDGQDAPLLALRRKLKVNHIQHLLKRRAWGVRVWLCDFIAAHHSSSGGSGRGIQWVGFR